MKIIHVAILDSLINPLLTLFVASLKQSCLLLFLYWNFGVSDTDFNKSKM